MWYITMVLSEVPSEEYFHNNYSDVFDPLNNETFWKHEIYGNPAKWNRILSKVFCKNFGSKVCLSSLSKIV